MALTTAAALALALTAASAGAQYYNTQKTAKRTDNALADQIRNQSAKQRQADAKVNAEVADLAQSRSDEHRAQSLDSYMDVLRKGRGKLEAGLTPTVGSDVFKAGSANAAQDVQDFAGDRAGLMARIDAPTLQRQDEAFGYGRLGTDIDLIKREAAGQNWLDSLRVKRASQRNAGLDALSSLLGGAAGAAGSMGTGAAAAGGASPFTAQGGAAAAGYGATTGSSLNKLYPWLQRAGG